METLGGGGFYIRTPGSAVMETLGGGWKEISYHSFTSSMFLRFFQVCSLQCHLQKSF